MLSEFSVILSAICRNFAYNFRDIEVFGVNKKNKIWAAVLVAFGLWMVFVSA
jgi:hypothetical protein